MNPPSPADLDKIERLLRRCERDARLLDGREYKHRPFAEAYRLLDLLREQREADDLQSEEISPD